MRRPLYASPTPDCLWERVACAPSGGAGRTKARRVAVAEQRRSLRRDPLIGGPQQLVQRSVLGRDGVRIGRLQPLENDHCVLGCPGSHTELQGGHLRA